MKFEYNVVKFDVNDVATTSNPQNQCACPSLAGFDLTQAI